MIVYSGDLVWEPQGDQAEKYGDKGPKPIIDDILLLKLRPGQVCIRLLGNIKKEIHAELHCQKGIGKEHAKWSPVGRIYALSSHCA